MELLKGICAYEGVVIGEVYVDDLDKLELNEVTTIPFDKVQDELFKLDDAISKSIKSLKNLKLELKDMVEEKELKIIDAHLLILQDPMYISDIKKIINKKGLKAQVAVKEITEKYVKMFDNIDSPLYKQRGLDVKDVSNRILETLKSEDTSYKEYNEKILVTKEIFPTELLNLHKNNINLKGIIMEYGGETSHLAILAKALKIPTLMGVKNIFDHDWKDTIILDTTESDGCVILQPTNEQLEEYQKKKKNLIQEIEERKKMIDLPSVTLDGVDINLYLNLGDMEKRRHNDINLSTIKGVGLLRTELLYMKSSEFPSADKQEKIYRDLIEDFGNSHYITIRTLDIGADKQLDYFKMHEETNPFLGLRGIRFSLKNKEIFKEQLRAILKLSATKNIKIMYPMVTNIIEVREANRVLEEVKSELRKENISFNENIPVGIMVEVPSVVMLADVFAKEVDFFSVGSNDLTQYILAADRLSETVGEIYDNYNPAVLRAIYHIKEIATKYGKEISVCGEMAGDLKGAIALLSLGIRDLSMVEASIPSVKALIRRLSIKELENIRTAILNSSDSIEVKRILKEYLIKN